MNILFFTLGHVSKFRGGVDRVTDTLALNFIQRGHEVFMISVWKAVHGDKIEPYQFFLPSQDIDSVENVNYLKYFLINKEIDIIVNQSEPIRLMKLLSASHGNIPIVSVIHTDPKAVLKAVKDTWDMWKLKEGKFKFIFKYPYYYLRRLYQNRTRETFLKSKYSYYYNECSAVVLLSDRFKSSFLNLARISDTKKLFAISNPITTDIADCSTYKKEKLILFVGRLEFSPKRLDRLFKVWSGIQDKSGWKISVLGDGPDRELYENIAKQFNINDIEFLGTVNPLPYYKKASILCVTSSFEGFSLVILEGLNHGVIPIAFDSYEAVYDLIEPGYNGFIVPSFSTKDYKSVLLRLMNNESLRNSMRENIIEKNNRHEFDVNAIVEQWLNLFDNIISE